MQESREDSIESLSYEIYARIAKDEFIDGKITVSELFMRTAYERGQMDSMMDALKFLYRRNHADNHVPEGILVLIAAGPYETVWTNGQAIAEELVSHPELLVRERAIQCYERWNSKKGLDVLRRLDCTPEWLQQYVDEIILDIERTGTE